MKNTQRGFISIIAVIIIIAVIGGGAYIYSSKKTQKDISLPDATFKATVDDPEAKILARGDINGDGFEDAIVREIHCGASCSISLQVVLNEKNITAKLLKDKNYPDTFSPAYLASSAIKSEVTSVSIKNGVISLTGKGLACASPNSEDICTEEKWNVIKIATYKFDGSNIVQLSVTP